MRKFMGSLKQPSRRSSQTPVNANSPDESIKRDIRQFIDSSSNPASGQGDEVLHLPKIVEAAEASPSAAAAATKQIRKTIDVNQFHKGYAQYHALMLFRILIDNPGTCKNVSKSIDDKFVTAVKTLLKQHRDPSVQQMAREMLDHFAQEKADTPELKPLIDMWLKEKGNAAMNRQSHVPSQWQPPMQQQQPHSNGRARHALPDQAELAGRIEEARTSAKLLIQLTQSTPPAEFNSNELIREFADRCQTAQRSLHGYMNASPGPDEETFQTLIETCEQLSLASSKHQRAALAARRQTSTPLARAENLYGNGQSRGASPNNAASPPPDARAPPANANQLNNLAPISRHTSSREQVAEKRAEPLDPFSDDHRVDANRVSYMPSSNQGRYYNRQSQPPAPFAELPTTTTPPSKESPFSPPAMNGEAVAPPPGPPPGRQAAHDEDPFQALGNLDINDTRRPLTADSDDLYSAHEPVTNGHGALQTGVNGDSGATSLPPRGKQRIKDDEPFSPVGGVSGSGWNY